MSQDGRDVDQHTPPPNGCRWCGIEERNHLQRWKPEVGWHQWVAPTSEQRKERMLARRKRQRAEDKAQFLQLKPLLS